MSMHRVRSALMLRKGSYDRKEALLLQRSNHKSLLSPSMVPGKLIQMVSIQDLDPHSS